MDRKRETNLKILREACIKKIKKANSWSDLARKINASRTSPIFERTKKVACENGLVKENKGFGNAKEISLNLKKIGEFVKENSDEFKEWEDFIHATGVAIT